MNPLDPTFWQGVGTVTVCLLVLASIVTGKGGLALLREVRDRDSVIVAKDLEIAENRNSIRELLSQHTQFIEKLETTNALLTALKEAQQRGPG